MDDETAPFFEVRATLADGSRLGVGPFATANAASEEARRLLGLPSVRRVETLRRQGEDIALIGVIGWPAPASRSDDDNRLRPRHIDGGVIW